MTKANQYIQNYETRLSLTRKLNNLANDEDQKRFEIKETIEAFDAEYFNKLERVNVRFNIGSRTYYENLVKIGKKYFDGFRTLKKKNFAIEIPEITDQMKKRMLDDCYYY